MTTVVIVTSDSSVGESLAYEIKAAHGNDVSVQAVYRDYNLPVFEEGDVILSDGTCKTREGDDPIPVPILLKLDKQVEQAGATLVHFQQPPRNASILARLFGRHSSRHTVKTGEAPQTLIDEVATYLK